jgi:hypothetical protein
MKTFTVAGTSILNGEMKVRFANDTGRHKVLHKNGHEDIQLVELPEPLTKEQAVEALLSQPLFADNADRAACIREFIETAAGNVAPKEPKQTKPKVEMKQATTTTVDTKPATTVESKVEAEVKPAPELPKTKDTMSEEDWATLEAVSLAKG